MGIQFCSKRKRLPQEQVANAVPKCSRPVNMVQAEEVVVVCRNVPEYVVCPVSESQSQTKAISYLTILKVLWLGEVRSLNHRKLDLLEALALEASPLLETLFGLCKRFALCHVSIKFNKQIR